MSDMLRRARMLLTAPNDYNPDVRILQLSERPRLFVVTDAMKRLPEPEFDPSDIDGNFANAVKENTAMNERPEPLVEQLRASLNVSKDQLSEQRERIAGEQKNADDAFNASVDSMTTQIAELTRIHEEQTADFVLRLQDADDAVAGAVAGLAGLPPPTPGSAETPATTPVKAG